MDPNEVRLRQARAQQTSASSVYTLNNPSEGSTANRPHGGDMDPNEVRSRLARMQQTSGSPLPAAMNSQPSQTVAFQGGVQIHRREIQSPQYGSSSHLINMPSSSPHGYNVYQTSQSPESAHSGQYFPAQIGQQPSFPGQVQQSPQTSHSGLANQVGCCQPQYN